MKKIITAAVLIAAMAVPALAAADTSKMDGRLRMLLGEPAQGKAMLGKAVKFDGVTDTVDCFIKSSDVLATEAAIVEAGGTVRTILATIITADVPVHALGAISDRKEVLALEAAKLLKSKMNRARAFTQVDVVQDGTGSGLSQAYKGNRVLVGVVDDQLNWSNTDFSGSNGTRVQYVENGSTYCFKEDIDDSSCNVLDTVYTNGIGHGTHVTGIAAGADGTYTGVAPEAWIAFVFNTATDADSGGTFSTAVVDACGTIFDTPADDDGNGWPTVINLSLGTSLGAHDDTSLLEQGLNELVDDPTKTGTNDWDGRAIVNAAGNENVNVNFFDSAVTNWSSAIGGIHAEIDVAAGASEGYRFGIWDPVNYGDTAQVDLWLDVGMGANCEVAFNAYRFTLNSLADFLNTLPTVGTTTNDADAAITDTGFAADTEKTDTDPGNIAIQVNTYTPVAAQNNKPHAIMQATLDTGGSASDLSSYAYDVIVRSTGGACTGHMWLYPDQTGMQDFVKGITGNTMGAGANGAAYTFVDGDSFYTTTIPGTASGVITAGSYEGRPTWVDIEGNTRNQDVYDTTGTAGGGTGTQDGKVSLFSSLGPTADGRTKPEIVAPGEPIISTLFDGLSVSTARLGNSTHWKLEGTSMASPHVAGVVALMLQKNNCLTTAEIKTALAATAGLGSLDSKTADAANTYGSGIVDALGAMNQIVSDDICFSGQGSTDGGSSLLSSGCFGTLVPVNPAAAAPALALMLAPLAAIVWRRRKR